MHPHRNHQCHILHYIGLLSDVVSLELTLLPGSIVSLRWKPPFSLDITVVDPDIEGYCVDVISTTSSSTLHSQCGINRTEFNYSLPVGTVCEDHTYSVTAVNVVGNGTRATISITNALQRKRILSPWCVAITASTIYCRSSIGFVEWYLSKCHQIDNGKVECGTHAYYNCDTCY